MNESGEDAYSLDVYVSDLLAAKGMKDDPETHAELLEAVQTAVNQAIIGALPSSDVARLEYYSYNEPTKEEIAQLLENAKFNPEEVVRRALERFRDLFLKGGKDE
ncbi:hypothetical protein IKX64_02735 [Candidatus Saccharibacteria bacterium]|nr:hypothetical protein [Candidatus Saccharibacteria bacterium]